MIDLKRIFFPGLAICGLCGSAATQSVIALESCGISYIDPQDANNGTTSQTRDTLVYQKFFDLGEERRIQSFFVDVNAFGGQQTDRARVYAILPDSSLKLLGSLSFGNCTECVDGFAFVDNDSLLVQGVQSRSAMEMWIQSLGQPPFALQGNLQSLNGVGRISGRIPFCAIGWKVEFIVNSNPANPTTEFSAHILCPRPEETCAITKEARVDCRKDSLYLSASVPEACFSGPVALRWIGPGGKTFQGGEAVLPLRGNEGAYYLEIRDECCTIRDSVQVERPSFAKAGPDTLVCQGDPVSLAGTGGESPYWTGPAGFRVEGRTADLAAAAAPQGGDYIFHALNEEGCEDTDTLRLEVHVPQTPSVQVSDACLGDTLRITLGNPAAFSGLAWLGPGGRPLASPVIPNFQPADAGRYSLTATDTLGCSVNLDFEVSGSQPPEVDFSIEESCDSVRVYAIPETYSYRWETGENGSRLATATGGVFRVTVTDPAGCASIDSVEVPAPDGPEIGLELSHPFCPNDPGSITIVLSDGDRPAIFSIDGGKTYSLSPEFKNLAPGVYPIAVQDELGCLKEITAEIIAPDTLGVALDYDRLEVRPFTEVSLQARTVGDVRRYQWLPGDIDTGGPAARFTASTDMDIRLIVEDGRGCKASTGFPLTIVLGKIYIPNAFSPNDDGLNDYFTFYSDNGSGEIIESLRIFDRWGRLLFEMTESPLNDESRGWDGTVSGKPAGPGVMAYYGVVRFGNGVKKTFKGDVTLMR